MRDDGVGIVTVERLRQMDLPSGVDVIDGGTGGMTLMPWFEGVERIILIDAVEMKQMPGTFAQFGIDDLLSDVGESVLSLHASGILLPLQLARELGLLPPLLLYGIQPTIVAPGLGLSPPVSEALSQALAAIVFSFRTP